MSRLKVGYISSFDTILLNVPLFLHHLPHTHMECIPDSLKVCDWEGGVAVGGCVGGGSASTTSFTLTSERLRDYLVLRLSQRSVVVRLHQRQLFILIVLPCSLPTFNNNLSPVSQSNTTHPDTQTYTQTHTPSHVISIRCTCRVFSV